jgi:predicted nicotinamide N-methyase
MIFPAECLPLTSTSTQNSSDLHALYQQISERYEVLQEEVALDKRVISMLRILDASRLLESIDPSIFSVDERFPYWAELWPSSIELARFCLEQQDLNDLSVLELGCGLGLAGIAATISGANVVFSDYEPDALLFARYNVLKNVPEDGCQSARFQLLDWRSEVRTRPMDLIIGADVIYERRNFIPILQFLRRNLRAGAKAVFTDPDRTTGMSFFAFAEREGFAVTVESRVLNRGGRARTILLGELLWSK